MSGWAFGGGGFVGRGDFVRWGFCRSPVLLISSAFSIYKFVQRGRSAEGKIIGEFIATGYIPSFIHEIELNRLPFGREKFTPPSWYVQLTQGNKNAA